MDVPNHDRGFSYDIKKYFATSVGDAEHLISSESKEQTDQNKPSDDSSTDNE